MVGNNLKRVHQVYLFTLAVRSLARQYMEETPPSERADFVAYRNALEVDKLLKDAELKHLVEEPHQNC